MSLFDWLLIGHLVGDFLLQSDRIAAEKPYRWRALFEHVAVYMTAIAAVVVGYALAHPLPLWLMAAVLLFILVTHIILDRRNFTQWWMRLAGISAQNVWLAIVLDQVFHLLTLALVAQVLSLASG